MMIYVGAATDKYVTDGGGKKVRLRMRSVEANTAVAEVFEGTLDEALLGSSRRVVVAGAALSASLWSRAPGHRVTATHVSRAVSAM